MTMMKWISFGLGILASVTGFVAAVYWYRSSKVGLKPIWGGLDARSKQEIPVREIRTLGFEPVDPLFSQMGWLAGLMQTVGESADLNKRAALWTAVSVALAAGSSVLGMIVSWRRVRH